ncbi:non-homologous end joining protein Ku [Candidatus Solirubrobacter pratensis]|uniref:non-homologous end joining protein Ku n=1 Tax=Candidatus Solirubrobacter pratensis TaxID=1298857 RepID=UPI0003F81B4C|nr:Ku protein [Candidatus Solirubrobacter pratensis]
MARSLWKGSLSFGLVNVPVALLSGVRDTDLHFRQLHANDHTPVETRRFCAEEDAEVPFEEIAHGYETDDGDLIVLTDAELATAAPRKTRTIEIEAFADLEEIDPIYFDHPYVLMPDGESEGTQRAYRLLVEVMERSERAALGRFVLRTKEYLVLVRARRERLVLTTMRFHDEVREPPKPRRKKPAKKQLDRAVALIEALGCPWEPERCEDDYEKRLKKIVRDKEKGKTVKVPEAEEKPSPIEDLMAALERSLQEVSA